MTAPIPVIIGVDAAIPGALRGGTPVCQLVAPRRLGFVVAVSGAFAWVAFNSDEQHAVSTQWVALQDLILNISDPTGALHLVWWLLSLPGLPKNDDLRAAGCGALNELAMIMAKARNGQELNSAQQGILRDYALIIYRRNQRRKT